MVAFAVLYPDLAFRPTANWPALHQEVNDGPAQAEALRAGWDELQAERRANGTHAKFCGEYACYQRPTPGWPSG